MLRLKSSIIFIVVTMVPAISTGNTHTLVGPPLYSMKATLNIIMLDNYPSRVYNTSTGIGEVFQATEKHSFSKAELEITESITKP